MGLISKKVSNGKLLSSTQAVEVVAKAMPKADFSNCRVLLIIPDATRTAPVGTMFKAIHNQIGSSVSALDIMIALGTHQTMSEAAIEQRLEISHNERITKYSKVQFFNHAWEDPNELKNIGTISANEISDLSGGLFEMD
ncbi:MAG: lactate racemase domain-containing protein, partial [Verrucomicrobiota bacterium]|nr:lactate racemase domain-containing protein [Verrucomicrobiota bacterium]